MISYDIWLYYVILYYIMIYYIILCYIVLYYIISYDIWLYYIILYYILYYIILYWLYYIILYYIILYIVVKYILIWSKLCHCRDWLSKNCWPPMGASCTSIFECQNRMTHATNRCWLWEKIVVANWLIPVSKFIVILAHYVNICKSYIGPK